MRGPPPQPDPRPRPRPWWRPWPGSNRRWRWDAPWLVVAALAAGAVRAGPVDGEPAAILVPVPAMAAGGSVPRAGAGSAGPWVIGATAGSGRGGPTVVAMTARLPVPGPVPGPLVRSAVPSDDLPRRGDGPAAFTLPAAPDAREALAQAVHGTLRVGVSAQASVTLRPSRGGLVVTWRQAF